MSELVVDGRSGDINTASYVGEKYIYATSDRWTFFTFYSELYFFWDWLINWLNFISQRWRWLAQRLTHVSAVATVLLMTKTITVKYYYSRAVLCHRVYHNFVRTQTPHDIAPKGYVQGTQLSFGGFKMYCPWTVEGSLLLTVCGAWLKPLHWESS